MKICAFVIVFSLFGALKAQKVVKFGAIFDDDDIYGLNVLDLSITRQNVFSSRYRLEPLIKRIQSMDAAKVEKAVCELVESGAVAIIGPKSIYNSDIVASLCNALNIPHIVSYHRTREIKKNPYHKYTRNIFPDSTLLSRSLVEVVKNFGWKRFAIIYDSDESLIRLNGVLQMFSIGYKSVNIYKFPKNKDDIKIILKEISKTFENRVIIDCNLENIAEIIRKGAEVNVMTDYMSYFLTSPDGHMLNIPEMDKIVSNFTAIRFMTEEDIEANNIANNWKKKKIYLNVDQSRIANGIASPNRLKIEAALIRDSVTVLATALEQKRLFMSIDEPTTRCSALDDGNQYWNGGSELLKNIDDGSANGITGPIDFDRNFKTRRNFHMDIIELEHRRDANAYQKTAEWSILGLVVTRTSKELQSQKMTNIQSKLFRVVTRLGMPFLEHAQSNGSEPLRGNNRFRGFIKDLMDHLAAEIGFKYELYLEPKNHLGAHDAHSGKWDGMIGAILSGDADLAACDFTITHERKTVIDFSIPFMNLGISILYSKPKELDPDYLAFLNPFATSVWLHMYTAMLCLAIALYVVSKLSQRDWENPHPCDEDPEELENIWNMRNCLWLSVGAIMQQGCDILPKGFGTRITAASWWFFALIVINSYTASLTAHLTKRQLKGTLDGVEDLAKGHGIKYGVMKDGSTEAFFKDSNVTTYQLMWAAMEHFEPSVFLEDNEAGIARVKRDDGLFAFLMESPAIDYVTQKDCDLIKVGRNLDAKAYGIGMPMNSRYREDINFAMLKLKEDRTIINLRDKWWVTENIPIIDGVQANCTKETTDDLKMDMSQVFGSFYVLGFGIFFSTLVGISEFLWNVRKVSVAQKITPYEAFRNEFMFACKVWITRKPIRQDAIELRESQSSSRSSENS